jgi:hypothetical protein
MRIQEAQKLTNPTDPDPEHCSEGDGKEAAHCGTSFKRHKKRLKHHVPGTRRIYSTVLCQSNSDKEVVRFQAVNKLADKNILSRETCIPVNWRCLLLALILVGSSV